MKTINYKNIEWYVLEKTEEYTKLLAKECLSEDIIKDICETESFWGNGMTHANNLKYGYSWEKSNIRKVLNDKFLDKYLDINDLFKKEVKLLTKEEVDGLDDDIKSCGEWYWTMTSYQDSTSRVWIVDDDGGLYNGSVFGSNGAVRPVIYLNSKNLDKEQTKENKKTKIERLTYENTFENNSELEAQEILVKKINELIDKLEGNNE